MQTGAISSFHFVSYRTIGILFLSAPSSLFVVTALLFFFSFSAFRWIRRCFCRLPRYISGGFVASRSKYPAQALPLAFIDL